MLQEAEYRWSQALQHHSRRQRDRKNRSFIGKSELVALPSLAPRRGRPAARGFCPLTHAALEIGRRRSACALQPAFFCYLRAGCSAIRWQWSILIVPNWYYTLRDVHAKQGACAPAHCEPKVRRALSRSIGRDIRSAGGYHDRVLGIALVRGCSVLRLWGGRRAVRHRFGDPASC